MEPIIFLIWAGLVLLVPLALAVSAYIGLRSGIELSRIIGMTIIGLIIHGSVVCMTFFLMFLMIFGGAHTEPVGNALSYPVRIVYLAIELFYAVAAFSFCSLVTGRSKPWPVRIPNIV